MYVCICHAITESDVESAESNGAASEFEVFEHFGVQPQCGRCVPSMRCYLKCANGGAAQKAAAGADKDRKSQGRE